MNRYSSVFVARQRQRSLSSFAAHQIKCVMKSKWSIETVRFKVVERVIALTMSRSFVCASLTVNLNRIYMLRHFLRRFLLAEIFARLVRGAMKRQGRKWEGKVSNQIIISLCWFMIVPGGAFNGKVIFCLLEEEENRWKFGSEGSDNCFVLEVLLLGFIVFMFLILHKTLFG